jgi:DnaJ-like protein
MGEYRAPKSRTSLREYWWFCLEHVRAYNASWDYYRGMSPAQIEVETRRDTAWQRPTWPLGRLGAAGWEQETLRDPLHVLAAGRLRRKGAGRRDPSHQAPADLREPLAALGLTWPLTMDMLKSRYKELAKANHPDTNGGDRAAEERFKAINLAYAALRSRLSQDPEFAAAG